MHFRGRQPPGRRGLRRCFLAAEEIEEVVDEDGVDGVLLDGAPVDTGECELEGDGQRRAVDDIGQHAALAVESKSYLVVGIVGLVGVTARYKKKYLATDDGVGEHFRKLHAARDTLPVDEIRDAGTVERPAYAVGHNRIPAAITDEYVFFHDC